MPLTLILGGIRSGKSAFAERLVSGPAVYIATMDPGGDAEMAERIARHRSQRPSGWPTIEATSGIASRVAATAAPTALLDGFGLVVAAALSDRDPARRITAEIDAIAADVSRRRWIVVSEEVGLSLVTADALGRRFQDLLGEANQRLAAVADRLVLVIAGRAIDLPA